MEVESFGPDNVLLNFLHIHYNKKEKKNLLLEFNNWNNNIFLEKRGVKYTWNYFSWNLFVSVLILEGFGVFFFFFFFFRADLQVPEIIINFFLIMDFKGSNKVKL